MLRSWRGLTGWDWARQGGALTKRGAGPEGSGGTCRGRGEGLGRTPTWRRAKGARTGGHREQRGEGRWGGEAQVGAGRPRGSRGAPRELGGGAPGAGGGAAGGRGAGARSAGRGRGGPGGRRLTSGSAGAAAAACSLRCQPASPEPRKPGERAARPGRRDQRGASLSVRPWGRPRGCCAR